MASDLEVLILILTASHQCELDVTAWWSQQDHIIRKKLRQGPEFMQFAVPEIQSNKQN